MQLMIPLCAVTSQQMSVVQLLMLLGAFIRMVKVKFQLECENAAPITDMSR